MPPWWYWYNTIDFLKYSWCAYMVNQFENNDPVWMERGESKCKAS